MILNLIFFVIGLLMLYYGAEWLVNGSSSLAQNLGMPPIVVGLTVVAFGTSSPEMVVSVISSLKDKGMIALGNVIGSNIFNITLVLGMVALFQPVICHRSVVRRDIPIMLGVSLYLLLISLNSELGRIEGATLFGGIILYTCIRYYIASQGFIVKTDLKRKPVGASVKEKGLKDSRIRQIAAIVLGIIGVVAGAEILIDSAVKIMKVFGVDDKFIGLTVVAFGTSLPELATSGIAVIKNELDISTGNLVGSNLFNILSVLGAALLVRPISVSGGFLESGLLIDYLVMIFTSLLLFIMVKKNHIVTRLHGLIFLVCYVGYITYLVKKL